MVAITNRCPFEKRMVTITNNSGFQFQTKNLKKYTTFMIFYLKVKTPKFASFLTQIATYLLSVCI